MKNITSVILFATLLCYIYSQATAPSFAAYVNQYNKTYSTSQYSTRQSLYNSRVAALTTTGVTYNMTAAVNNFTDWTTDELKKIRGYTSKSNAASTTPYVSYSNPPSALDWRSKKGVTAVQYQQTCAADWAFAATAYAESKLAIDGRYDDTINLSQQKILQCTSGSSCSGGYLEDAMTTAMDSMQLEIVYGYKPFESSIGICQLPGIWIGNKVQNYYNLTDDQLIQLLQERPVAVAVASTGWQSYSSGVFTCAVSSSADHAALLVGYNPNYWIVKNSWGSTWGESGYIRISRIATSNCKLGSVVVRTFQWHLLSAAIMAVLTIFMIM